MQAAVKGKSCCLVRGEKPTQRSTFRHDPLSRPASLGSCLSLALRCNRFINVKPSFACNLDARQSGSKQVGYVSHSTLQHSSDGQGQGVRAHLGAANVTSGFVCHRCRCRCRRRRRYQRTVQLSIVHIPPSMSSVPWSTRPRAQTSVPFPIRPTPVARIRPCTHSYPSVTVVPTPVLVSRVHWSSGQRQRHRAHDPWRSCMCTSFPAILPICSRVLTIPFWMDIPSCRQTECVRVVYVCVCAWRQSRSCRSLAPIFCTPSSCSAGLRE